MKKSINIYTYLKDNARLWKVLDDFYDYVKIKDFDEFLNILSKTRRDDMYLYIIDIEKLKDKKYSYFKNELLNNEHLFVVVYGENISQTIKAKLHSLEVSAIIEDKSQNHKNILDHVIVKANLYMATLDNRFTEGFFEYHDLKRDIETQIKYLLSFVSYKYKIDGGDISDIHLLLSSLLLAFKRNKILKISKILHKIMKSEPIDMLYKTYTHPQSFKQSVIAILLMIFQDEETQKHVEQINMKNIEKSLISEIQNIYDTKATVIISHQDVNYFWEQLVMGTVEKYNNKDNINTLDSTIVLICKLLIYALSKVEYMEIYTVMSFSDTQMEMHIKLFGDTNTILKEYIESKLLSTGKFIVEMQDNNKIILTLKALDSKSKKSKKVTIDKSIIDTMHYKDEHKISAEDFLKEYEIDQYLLDDLNDLETQIRDKLYTQDTLSKEILSAVSTALGGYVRVLNETIEFENIAYSLQSLSLVLNELSLETLDDTKQNTLRFYIQGLIDDLSTWKRYIFIEPNTPDIHYLDASLLENCATIEKFILSDLEDETLEEENNNDDDLEFF
ncbi:hypothetical protein [Hydrogenimonas sp.]